MRQEQQVLQPGLDSSSLFSFGVVSDVQYADIEDGKSFHGVPRFYRNALPALQRCVQGWTDAGVSFGIHLGDIVDGFQAAAGQAKSEAALAAVLDCFAPLQRPVNHLIGNHCLYNLTRAQLNERLAIPAPADGASYFATQPHPAWRLLFIDSYDISLLGWPADHPRHQQAAAILEERNPNKEKNSPEGLVGLDRRFVKFGGGLSDTQLAWLDNQLQAAAEAGQCVIVCSHLPIYPGTCPPACLVWNYQAVLDRLQRHPGVVAATIAGHTHQNGYLVDEAGIHHLVLPAVVETPPGRDCYGWVDVTRGSLVLRGVDTCMSCRVQLSEAAMQHQQRHFTQLPLPQQQQRRQLEEEGDGVKMAVAGLAAIAGTGNGSSSSISDFLVEVADEQQQHDKGSEAAAATVAAELAAVRLAAE